MPKPTVRQSSLRKFDSRRPAFTMLELIISLGLTVLLLSTAWSLVEMYRSMFERGERQIEQAQVIRSLSQMLSDDLNSAIQDPGNRYIKPDPDATEKTRYFGLAGTATTLRIDILQINPFDTHQLSASATGSAYGSAANQNVPMASGTSTDASALPADLTMQTSIPQTLPGLDDTTSDNNRPLQAPELKTVFYTFVDPMTSGDYTATAKPGLTRRELDFETPPTNAPGSGSSGSFDPTRMPGYVPMAGPELTGSSSTTVTTPPGSTPWLQTGSDSGQQIDPNRLTLMQIMSLDPNLGESWVPEVISLRLRYFDGLRWRSSWDSIKQKGLPVAIECVYQVRSMDDMEDLRAKSVAMVGQQRRQTIQQLSLDMPQPVTRRIVVNLPGSPLRQQKTPQRSRSQTPQQPRMRQPRLQQPRATQPQLDPTQPGRQLPTQSSDGWLRVD